MQIFGNKFVKGKEQIKVDRILSFSFVLTMKPPATCTIYFSGFSKQYLKI